VFDGTCVDRRLDRGFVACQVIALVRFAPGLKNIGAC
jgi:hypothetical protein